MANDHLLGDEKGKLALLAARLPTEDFKHAAWIACRLTESRVEAERVANVLADVLAWLVMYHDSDECQPNEETGKCGICLDIKRADAVLHPSDLGHVISTDATGCDDN